MTGFFLLFISFRYRIEFSCKKNSLIETSLSHTSTTSWIFFRFLSSWSLFLKNASEYDWVLIKNLKNNQGHRTCRQQCLLVAREKRATKWIKLRENILSLVPFYSKIINSMDQWIFLKKTKFFPEEEPKAKTIQYIMQIIFNFVNGEMVISSLYVKFGSKHGPPL